MIVVVVVVMDDRGVMDLPLSSGHLPITIPLAGVFLPSR